jgi:hypothetical protein
MADVACKFTVDNEVKEIYFDNQNLLSSVAGDLTDWTQLKSFEVKGVEVDRPIVLGIKGHEADPDPAANGLYASGLLLTCQSTDTFWGSVVSESSGTPWRVNRNSAPELAPGGYFSNNYDASSWPKPSPSASGFSCAGCGTSTSGKQPTQIWLAGANTKDVAFYLKSTPGQAAPAQFAGAGHGAVLGSGWRLVRRVAGATSSKAPWHPTDDQLRGTAVYGTPDSETGSSTFSIAFGEVSEFLFMTGDRQLWLHCTADAARGSFWSYAKRPIIHSSATPSNTPYTAGWYRRSQNLEDPWISITDHAPATTDGNMLYGENSYNGPTAHSMSLWKHNGANVWVR